MGCNLASNANRKHGLTENYESPSQKEGSISAENAHCSIQNQMELSVYENQKAYLFQMLDNHFPDRKTRFRLTLMGEFIGKFILDHWTLDSLQRDKNISTCSS